MPHILELTLNNSSCANISQTILSNGPRLMKLKLSDVNLNFETDAVSEILESCGLLQAIDFSWTYLTPVNLQLITKSLLAR